MDENGETEIFVDAQNFPTILNTDTNDNNNNGEKEEEPSSPRTDHVGNPGQQANDSDESEEGEKGALVTKRQRERERRKRAKERKKLEKEAVAKAIAESLQVQPPPQPNTTTTITTTTTTTKTKNSEISISSVGPSPTKAKNTTRPTNPNTTTSTTTASSKQSPLRKKAPMAPNFMEKMQESIETFNGLEDGNLFNSMTDEEIDQFGALVERMSDKVSLLQKMAQERREKALRDEIANLRAQLVVMQVSNETKAECKICFDKPINVSLVSNFFVSHFCFALFFFFSFSFSFSFFLSCPLTAIMFRCHVGID